MRWRSVLAVMASLVASGCVPAVAGAVLASSGGGGGGSGGGAPTGGPPPGGSPPPSGSPVVLAVSPSTIPHDAGGEVRITFRGAPLVAETSFFVVVGGAPASDVRWSQASQTLRFQAPANPLGNRATTADISLGAFRPSTRPQITYEARPIDVADVSPLVGPDTGGRTVKLTGTGFVEGMRVLFGGVAGRVTFVLPTEADVDTPPAAAPGSVAITVEHPDFAAPHAWPTPYVYEQAPRAALLSPNGGERVAGELDLRWTTTDDQGPHVVELRLSANSGMTFPYVIASQTTDTGKYRWDVTGLPDGTTFRARVVPRDGTGYSGPAAISSADFTIDNTPRRVAARYEDANRNALVDAGDAVVLALSMDLVLNGAAPGHLQLPVAGDTFGAGATLGAGTSPNELKVTLGTSPTLRPRGAFDAAVATAGSPSGVDLAAVLPADVIESSATGRDAVASGAVDLVPGFVEAQALGGAYAHGNALADLDGDGDLDLVEAGSVGTGTRGYRNDGGSFTLVRTFDPGTSALDVAVFDVDGDGDRDVVVASQRVHRNDGSWTFTAVSVVPAATQLAHGDVDGDGDVDLVCGQTAGFAPALNDGTGTFVAQAVSGTGHTWSLILVDLDADGDLDVVRGGGSGTILVETWLNAGDGTFGGGATLFSQRGVPQVAAGDVDGDGDPDLAVSSSSGQPPARVLLNAGDGTFLPGAVLLGELSFACALVDFDGDGDLDVVTGREAWINDGSGRSFQPSTIVFGPTTASVRHLAVGDVDGDGDLDVVTASFTSPATSRVYAGSAGN